MCPLSEDIVTIAEFVIISYGLYTKVAQSEDKNNYQITFKFLGCRISFQQSDVQHFAFELVILTSFKSIAKARGGEGRGAGSPHMKGVGMLAGNFELNP